MTDEQAHSDEIRDLLAQQDSLLILSQLHDERLTAPEESVTISIKDVIDLVVDVDPTKESDPNKEELRAMDSLYRKELLPLENEAVIKGICRV